VYICGTEKVYCQMYDNGAGLRTIKGELMGSDQTEFGMCVGDNELNGNDIIQGA